MTRCNMTAVILLATVCATGTTFGIEPIPNRIVVLTFDDSVKSHFTVVRPVLKRHGFGATFFVTEGFDFPTNKTDYMSWDEIAQLDRDGFEIGNHTRDHMPVTGRNLERLAAQLRAINDQCVKHKIPKPISFGYPGNAFDLGALPILSEAGIRFARRGTEPELPYELGAGLGYEPGLDHPLLIPTAGDARPDWKLEDFKKAAERGQGGRIAVLQFHGVPDRAHPWVHTSRGLFEACMQYLADNRYTVVALRDLARYVPLGSEPKDPEMVIRDRQQMLASNKPLTNARTPRSEADLRYWIENMFVYHRFSPAEMVAATGLSDREIAKAIERFGLKPSHGPQRKPTEPLTLLPYPGGRHPRIGFRDGEVRPQRETKFSVFTPWDANAYVVLDIPEAIWIRDEEKNELLYLAHTHIPTYWDKRDIELPKLEWERGPDGDLKLERRLPNGITFRTFVHSEVSSIRMKMSITNGTDKTITGLRVQNCVMLRSAKGFHQQTSENKLLRKPFGVCRNPDGTRWIITAWKPCRQPWGNAPCPCLHSDPQFPDCEPGQTQWIVGWLSFYEGKDIDTELKRIEATDWFLER